jgi:hypothetical protein
VTPPSPRRLLAACASRGAALAVTGGWLTVYVLLAIWSGDALATLTGALSTSAALRLVAALSLTVLAASLARAVAARWRRGRVRAVLWAVLPAGSWLYLAGLFASVGFGDGHWQRVGIGHEVRVPWSDRVWVVAEIRSPLADEWVDTGGDGPIFNREPEVLLTSGDDEVVVGAFPATRTPDGTMNIMDFGLAPGIEVRAAGRVVDSGYAPLRLLPPGNPAVFEPQGVPQRFELRLAPTRYRGGAADRRPVYRLDQPTYQLTARRGDRVVFEGEVQSNTAFDGITVAFSPPTVWAWLQVKNDPGQLLVWAGLWGVILGLPLTLALLLTGALRGRRGSQRVEAVGTAGEGAHAEEGDEDEHHRQGRDPSHAPTAPAVDDPQVDVQAVGQPHDERPGLDGVPAPVAAPEEIGPEGAGDDHHGAGDEAEGDEAKDGVV